MPSILDVVGTNTYNSYSDAAAGTDYVSRYIPRNRYASPVTGAIGGGLQRPIMFRYIQIYNGTTSTGSLDLEIATAASGAGGMQSGPNAIPGSDQDPDYANYDSSTALGTGPLQYACMATDASDNPITYYYGLYKNDGNRVYFYTGASANTSWNPANVYVNGTISTAFPSRVIGGRMGWFHVPNAPTSLTASGVSSGDSGYTGEASFSWVAPTDDGGMAVNGYRLAFQYYINNVAQGWWVLGTATAGSPSGTTGTSHYVYGFPTNCKMDVIVSALNGVSDNHSGGRAYAAVAGPVTGGNYTSTGAHTGTNSSVLTITTPMANPSVSGSYTTTAKVNQSYSSSVTFSQDMGYSANTNGALTYSLASGTIPPGLTRTNATISGTPTTPGSYTFTIRATNADGKYRDISATIVVSTLGPLVSPSNGSAPSTRASVKVHNGTTFVDGIIQAYDGTTPYSANGWKYLK